NPRSLVEGTIRGIAQSLPDLFNAQAARESEAATARAAVLDALADLGVLGAREPWQADAACRGHSAVMFPARGADPEPARELCAGCPVLLACRSWGDRVEGRDVHGFLAGESAARRTARRRASRRAA